MDDRLKKALAFSHFRQTLNNQIEIEKTKIKNLLTVAHNGGFFFVDYSLMTYVDMQIRAKRKAFVLLDKNMTPIKIDDPKHFLEVISSRFHEATNAYHTEYTRLSKSRNVKTLLGSIDE